MCASTCLSDTCGPKQLDGDISWATLLECNEYGGDPGEAVADSKVEHRFAVILCADVVGYSRLMGIDEEGTLAALRAVRRELVDPKIVEHRGRIVRTMGDGLLVEFSSVVDAVRCAVAIQEAMPAHGADTPA